MLKAHDSYLQAAEGFLHAIREDIDKMDADVTQMLAIAQTYALVSIARSLNAMAEPTAAAGPPVEAAPTAD